jgi:nitrate/nitrite-specific signal transduction histidine kinase
MGGVAGPPRRGRPRDPAPLPDDEPPQYLVAVPANLNQVVRLAVPLDDVLETRARMRNRLLVVGGFGFAGCLLLSWSFIRAITRLLQAMTHGAEKLARSDYEVRLSIDSDGEFGELARAMNRMPGEVKARVGELTEQRAPSVKIAGRAIKSGKMKGTCNEKRTIYGFFSRSGVRELLI